MLKDCGVPASYVEDEHVLLNSDAVISHVSCLTAMGPAPVNGLGQEISLVAAETELGEVDERDEELDDVLCEVCIASPMVPIMSRASAIMTTVVVPPTPLLAGLMMQSLAKL